MSSRATGKITVLASVVLLPTIGLAQTWKCKHCKLGEAFSEFLPPVGANDNGNAIPGAIYTDVHSLWATHVEVVPTTTDIGGWLPPSFHERLAAEAIRGWEEFRDKIMPSLSNHHPVKSMALQQSAGALNDGFFHYQKRLFENSGDVQKALGRQSQEGNPTPHPDAPSSWPGMNKLPEYRLLRKVMDRFSRRYLVRSGMDKKVAFGLNYSIFNWAAVHGPGEFHGPHTHVGEYHVAVFYAQAGRASGKLRLGDPRGHSPPFGQHYFHTVRSGDLVIFPSWLSHMATVTAASSDIIPEGAGAEPYRVTFAFNIGPVTGPLPCHLWWSDPTRNMAFHRRSRVDFEDLGMLGDG